MLTAAIKGEVYADPNRKTKAGTARAVRAWFFQKGTGWYVHARYGARVLLLDGKSNAVMVGKIADIEAVLTALDRATEAGDLDAVLAAAGKRGTREKAQ